MDCKKKDCKEPVLARDLCNMHYQQAWKLEPHHGSNSKSTEQRFWEKVKKTDRCWIWQGATTSTGYGLFGVTPGLIRAHRYSYEKAKGPIPKDLVLDHLCRTKLCVRSSHLDAITQKENVQRHHKFTSSQQAS